MRKIAIFFISFLLLLSLSFSQEKDKEKNKSDWLDKYPEASKTKECKINWKNEFEKMVIKHNELEYGVPAILHIEPEHPESPYDDYWKDRYLWVLESYAELLEKNKKEMESKLKDYSDLVKDYAELVESHKTDYQELLSCYTKSNINLTYDKTDEKELENLLSKTEEAKRELKNEFFDYQSELELYKIRYESDLINSWYETKAWIESDLWTDLWMKKTFPNYYNKFMTHPKRDPLYYYYLYLLLLK